LTAFFYLFTHIKFLSIKSENPANLRENGVIRFRKLINTFSIHKLTTIVNFYFFSFILPNPDIGQYPHSLHLNSRHIAEERRG